MSYDVLVHVVALMAVLSIAVERSVEITVNVLKIDQRFTGNAKKAIIHLIGVATGALIYLLNSDQQIPYITEHLNAYTAPLVVGLLASGGSGFWHEVMKVVSSLSVKKQ